MKIKNVIVLEALRTTKSTIPLPLAGKWKLIGEPIKQLFSEGLLEIKGNDFVISPEGKKVAMLFNDKRKDLISPFESYKTLSVNGTTIDARLPIASYNVRGNIADDVALDYLQNLNVFLIWENFFSWIKNLEKEGTEWQGLLLESFKLQSGYNVDVNAWKRLGIDEPSAEILAAKITCPVTQITSL